MQSSLPQDGMRAQFVNLERANRIPLELYDRLRSSFPFVCVDVFIRNPETGEILLPKRNMKDTTPGEFWPIGGRLLLGEKPEDAIVRKCLLEAGIEVDGKSATLIAIGDGRYAINGNRHTINLTYVVDLKPGQKAQITDTGEFIDAVWVSSLEDLKRAESHLHPYVKHILKDSGVFEGRVHGPAQTLYSDEEKGVLIPYRLMALHRNEGLALSQEEQVSIDKGQRYEAFEKWMPGLRVKALVVDARGRVLAKHTGSGVRLVIEDTTLHRGSRPETVAGLEVLLNEPGLNVQDPVLVGVEDVRANGIDAKDKLQTIELVYALSHPGKIEGSEYVWLKRSEVRGLDPEISKTLERSGILERNYSPPQKVVTVNN